MLGRIHAILNLLKFDVVYHKIKDYLPQKFRGWVGKNLEECKPIPLVTARELQPRFKSACRQLTDRIGANGIGDYLEFGVCYGTSLHCMFQTLKEMELDHVRLFGFDSFKGLPPIAAIDIENYLQPGDYASSLDSTTRTLTRKGIDWSRTFLIEGWFQETLNHSLIKNHNIKKASFIMLDCDLYSSAKEALEFCLPLIKDTSIIFLDDWCDDKDKGERRAFHEFLKAHPHVKSEYFDSYSHNGKPTGKVFMLTNTLARSA
jgi:hypothetical protein